MAGDETDGLCVSKQGDGLCVSKQGFQEEGEIHSQLPTQPIEELEEEDTQIHPQVWGQLYPHCGTFPRLALSTDSFKLGRGRSMDYVIRESDMGSAKWLTAVSKVQCEIIKSGTEVFVRDHSSNGTWLNGKKIGKNNMRPLEHDSELCFSAVNKKVFVFRSMSALRDQFPSQLTDKYTVSKLLGRGACGEVRLGFRIPDLHRVAIKVICKKKTSTVSSAQTIMNEVRILRTVKHPCIINLEDVIDTPDFLFIVLELAEGGELFEKIIERTKFNEPEAKLHFYQIASAMQYLHSKNICHRDLKPENVLLCSLDDSRPVVKITDMGMSKLVDLGTVLKTFCGTPNYLAPEVIKMAHSSFASYTMKVDCWSLGVILYILLSGTPPFCNERQGGVPLRTQILTANYVFYPQLFNSVSEPAKDLIRKLLKVEPEERLSADEIMQHPWVQDSVVSHTAKSIMKEQMDLQARRSFLLNKPFNVLANHPTNLPTNHPTNLPAPVCSPVSVTVMKRNVPMDVDTDCGPEKKSRVEINLVPQTD